ncbi:MAG: metallophosphoesterase [Alphaproteobacteria bacterium]|nr:metallophosphoesterase [Alphaproteobacteria bacterium]|tara:strand:+ start:378 stop:1148 length:771 start_codon:yes stop_codon:yes gene_type:complete
MDIKSSQTVYFAPKGLRIYAIGDLHGHYDALVAIHLQIDKHIQENPHDNIRIVYVGDYIDRGPESSKILTRLSLLKNDADGIERVFLLGNHETAFLGFMKEPLTYGPNWLKYGGVQTLQSYGIEVGDIKTILPGEMENYSRLLKEKIPQDHIDFLLSLNVYHEAGGYLFVHAGIDPSKPLDKQKRTDFTTIRSPFLKSRVLHEKRIVHGHSISTDVEILPNRIGIDTGYYDSGLMSAIVIEGAHVEKLQAKLSSPI